MFAPVCLQIVGQFGVEITNYGHEHTDMFITNAGYRITNCCRHSEQAVEVSESERWQLLKVRIVRLNYKAWVSVSSF